MHTFNPLYVFKWFTGRKPGNTQRNDYYRLMTKWSGLGDSTELSWMGLSQRDSPRRREYPCPPHAVCSPHQVGGVEDFAGELLRPQDSNNTLYALIHSRITSQAITSACIQLNSKPMLSLNTLEECAKPLDVQLSTMVAWIWPSMCLELLSTSIQSRNIKWVGGRGINSPRHP
jgi:hypothetical protein